MSDALLQKYLELGEVIEKIEGSRVDELETFNRVVVIEIINSILLPIFLEFQELILLPKLKNTSYIK